MGVLKKITKEYFEESLRKEDGKFGTLVGHRVVMPLEIDEMEFLKCFELPYLYTALEKGYKKSPYSMSGVEYSIKIEGGKKSEKDLYMYGFEDFRKKENCSKFGITEKMFDSFVDLLRDELKDIEAGKTGDIVVGNYERLRKLVEGTEFDFGDLMLFVITEADEEFEFLLTKRSDHHIFYINNDNSNFVLVSSMGYSGVRIEHIVYARTIREWVEKKIDNIERDGLENYMKEGNRKRLERWKKKKK